MDSKNKSSKLTSLSKNALYAPLNTYLNGTKRDSNKAVNANLREKALYAFIETISAEYHSPNTSLGLENGAHNGGLALNARQVEQKLSQRALTLIKGGISSSVVKSTSTMVDGDRMFDRARRREKNDNSLVRLNGSISNKKRKRARNEIANKVAVDNPAVLFGLNQIWKRYMQVLLSNAANSKEILSLIASSDLTGAIASVVRCNACKSYRGKIGIIIDTSKNTWKIATPKHSSKVTEEEMKACKEFKVIVAPKRFSTLLIRIDEKSFESSHIQISGNE